MAATVFDKITESKEALGELLRSLPVADSPWDKAFHKRYCNGCTLENCDPCPREEQRSNPEWWLGLEE